MTSCFVKDRTRSCRQSLIKLVDDRLYINWRPEAWECIYFHPDQTFMASQQHKKTLAPDNISNLHRGLELALESLKVEMEKENTITWKHLPWNGRTYKVKMKFAVAFVIGDTELHDKLCCRYGGRNSDVKKTQSLESRELNS